MNKEILAGMRCPNCRSYGPFDIEVKLYVRATDSEVDRTMNDVEWEQDDACYCCKCGHTLTVRDFTIGSTPDLLGVARSALAHLGGVAYRRVRGRKVRGASGNRKGAR